MNMKEQLRFEQLEADLRAAVTGVLRHSGIAVEPVEYGPLTTSIFEPFIEVSPSHWIGPTAFHLKEILGDCEDVHEWLGSLPTLGVEEIRWRDLWGAVVDLRFHALYFQLCAENIREKMADRPGSPWQLSQPDIKLDCAEPSAASDSLTSQLGTRLGEPISETRILRDLQKLDEGCRVCCSAIAAFASEPDADSLDIVRRFANVQAASLMLSLALIRADVVLAHLAQCLDPG